LLVFNLRSKIIC